ncbi:MULTISPECIES: hypothetical protein [Spirosoma]|nr:MULTISPECIES: hypothetical protein [Spirosoma]
MNASINATSPLQFSKRTVANLSNNRPGGMYQASWPTGGTIIG